MAKLINLNVYDAKNMICVWNENNPNEDFRCGIALENAQRGFMIPRHYIVGVFDDGTVKSAGIFGLNDINNEEEGMFLFHEFCYYVDLFGAKAFVKKELADDNIKEKQAKDRVYECLLESGVRIEEEARQYLTSE